MDDGTTERVVRARLRHVVREKRRATYRPVIGLVVFGALVASLVALLGFFPAVTALAFLFVVWLNLRVFARRRATSQEARGPSTPFVAELELEREATLGADGLALDGRFVARDALSKIEVRGDACTVTTADGERIELRGTPLDLARAARIASDSPNLPRDEAGEALLGRIDVDAIRLSRDGYRGISIDASRCLSIAEDPRADVRARVAAAELVGDRLDDTARVRIAAAAEETANADVREALLACVRRSES